MKSASKFPGIASFDLIYGLGNVGRQDDGLGWAFIDALETPEAKDLLRAEAELVRHYQLFFEDVDLLRRHERALFIDATKASDVERYGLGRPEAKLDHSFTSHAISVSSILAICEDCYQVYPEVWILGIRGYSWELELGLSGQARRNLDKALTELVGLTSFPARPAGNPAAVRSGDLSEMTCNTAK